jgi:hypothetical protein
MSRRFCVDVTFIIAMADFYKMETFRFNLTSKIISFPMKEKRTKILPSVALLSHYFKLFLFKHFSAHAVCITRLPSVTTYKTAIFKTYSVLQEKDLAETLSTAVHTCMHVQAHKQTHTHTPINNI